MCVQNDCWKQESLLEMVWISLSLGKESLQLQVLKGADDHSWVEGLLRLLLHNLLLERWMSAEINEVHVHCCWWRLSCVLCGSILTAQFCQILHLLVNYWPDLLLFWQIWLFVLAREKREVSLQSFVFDHSWIIVGFYLEWLGSLVYEQLFRNSWQLLLERVFEIWLHLRHRRNLIFKDFGVSDMQLVDREITWLAHPLPQFNFLAHSWRKCLDFLHVLLPINCNNAVIFFKARLI